MARRNPELEERDRLIAMLQRQIAAMRADPGDIPDIGCGDHSCVSWAGPGGQGTNGGCCCDERRLRRAVMWWRRRAQFLEVTIKDMRTRCSEDNA